MFNIDKTALNQLLKDADKGVLQLPDFQRDYVWNDDDVRSLIASIAKGFPVGALLTLQTGGEVKFKSRMIVGVPERSSEPQELLLDGQQRITSLYQALFSQNPVGTCTPQGKQVERYYYIDIKKAVREGTRIEEAIEGVPRDKIRRIDFGRTVDLDLSSSTAEFENHFFPLNLVFEYINWLFDWRYYWKERNRESEVESVEREFLQVLKNIEGYQMPLIRLSNQNSREAICLVFEKVNVGGKKLDAFALVTAIFAADDFDLRKDWRGPRERKFTWPKGTDRPCTN